jgi:AraC-like DNA-binding protein
MTVSDSLLAFVWNGDVYCTEMRHPLLTTTAILKAQPAGYAYQTADYDHLQVIYLTEGLLHFRTSHCAQVLTTGSGVLLRMGSAFQLSCPDTGYRGVGMNVFEPTQPEFQGPAAAFIGNRAFHEIAMLIHQEISHPDVGTAQMLDGLGTLLYWHALRLAGASALPPGTAQEWAERARQAILATLTTGNSVRQVLGTLPLSYRQLTRHFIAHIGLPPKQYQQQVRLEEIKRLLRETSVSITTLAHEFGYPSSQHFSAQFKRATGLTPNNYRRQYQ